MPDDMFLSPDRKSLWRGRRIARRTQIFRPCLVWPREMPEMKLHGVALDVSPYGLRIRMLEDLPPGTEVRIQLMRDDEFEEPLARPIAAEVVRNTQDEGGFVDHGVSIPHEAVERKEHKPLLRPLRPIQRLSQTRMHTIDFRIGGKGIQGR
ncbi:MAG: PilZ domain-containing protein [Candidatus Hydrogenedentota bacterium]